MASTSTFRPVNEKNGGKEGQFHRMSHGQHQPLLMTIMQGFGYLWLT